MTPLSQQSRALLAASCHGDHIGTSDKLRIRRKLDRRIGAGVALGAVLTTGATGAEAARSTLFATAASWLPSSAKFLSVMAIAGATTVGVVQGSHLSSPPVESTSVVSRNQSASPKPRPFPAQVAATSAVERVPTDVEPLPNPSVEHVAPRVAIQPRKGAPATTDGSSTQAPAQAEPGLGAQISAIRESRAAVRRGDPRAALAALEEESLPNQGGALEQEALLVRVMGLCLKGDAVEARRVADQLLTRYPDSMLRSRVLGSCAFQQALPDAPSAR